MTIFEELDKLSFKHITPEQLQEYVKNNPEELFTLKDDIPVYAYAGLLSLECLRILHESTKETLTPDRLPWEISNMSGERAIHFVTESNISKSLKYLILDVGVDANAKTNIGNTALHIACSREFPEIVTILLRASNADINSINENGLTPLMIGATRNHIGIVSILLKSNPLLIYIHNGITHDTYDIVNRIGSLEMKNLFNKYKKTKKRKVKGVISKKRMLLERKDMISTYNWYCSSLEDNLGIKGVVTFARHLGIHVDSSEYASKIEMKKELCKKIAKQITMSSIRKKLS
jgi:hypothetical protein